MKHTTYSRNLLALCRKMRGKDWELVKGAIRRTNRGPMFKAEQCPLSQAGDQNSVLDYRAGGRVLGFNPAQTGEIAQASDFSGWVIGGSVQKLRRILLRAARLKEKEGNK